MTKPTRPKRKRLSLSLDELGIMPDDDLRKRLEADPVHEREFRDTLHAQDILDRAERRALHPRDPDDACLPDVWVHVKATNGILSAIDHFGHDKAMSLVLTLFNIRLPADTQIAMGFVNGPSMQAH